MGVSVGGSNSTSNTEDLRRSERADESRASAQADQAQLNAQLDRQAQAPSSDQMAAFIAQIQAQQNQASSQGSGQSALDAMPEGVRVKAQAIASQVISQILHGAATTGAATATQDSQDSGASDDQGAAASASDAPGGGSPDDPETAVWTQIQQASQLAVYGQLQTQVQQMQSTEGTKQQLGQDISAINMALAGHKSGDTVKVPVYEYDKDTGEVSFKGVQSMDYDKAQAMQQGLQDGKDSLGDMSQQQMLMLQQAMDNKSQFEEMISNIMKAAASTEDGLLSNVKG